MLRVLVLVRVEFIVALGWCRVLLNDHDLTGLLCHCLNRTGRLLAVHDLACLNFNFFVLSIVASIKSSLTASLTHQRQWRSNVSRLSTLVDIFVHWF